MRAYHREHEQLLNFPVFWINEAKRQALAEVFGEVVRTRKYTCYACAVLSNHAHFVIRIHRDQAQVMLAQLMEASRVRLRSFDDISDHHPVWSARPYKVFLYTPQEVRGRIRYVHDNPAKEGLSPQSYDFVLDYNGWPLHKNT